MGISAGMSSVRILIADDHALIRAGLRTLLAHEPRFEVVAEAADGQAAVEAAERERPQVAILDIGMPVLNGIEAARRISAAVFQSQGQPNSGGRLHAIPRAGACGRQL